VCERVHSFMHACVHCATAPQHTPCATGAKTAPTRSAPGSCRGARMARFSPSLALLRCSLPPELLRVAETLAHLYPSTRLCTGAWARERAVLGAAPHCSPWLSVCHRNFAPTRRVAAAARTLACALTRDFTHGLRRCGLHSRRMTTTQD